MWELIATAAAGLNAGAGLSGVITHHAAMETGVTSYTTMFPKWSSACLRGGSVLSALSAASSLAAYFVREERDRDPAWLTAGLLAAVPILYQMLILAPAKSTIENPVMADQPVKDRESWLQAWGLKKYVEFGLLAIPFGAMLLVLGTEKEEGGGLRSRF